MIRAAARLSLITALGLALCACASQPQHLDPGATTEEPKPIEVKLVKLTHVVSFKGQATGLSAAQDTDLSEFLVSSDAKPGDRVVILAAASPMAADRAAFVTARLAAKALAASVVRDSSQPDDQLRIVVERYVASAPDCPDWSRLSWANFDNQTSTNFGCATSADLAAMVADPHDLVAGQTMGPAMGDAATLPVQKYRAGLTPVLGGGGSSSGGGGGGGGGASGASAGSGP
jgi:pilus assembly protein CpaD